MQIACLYINLYLDTPQYLALHDLRSSAENSDDIFACKAMETEEENELYIAFLEEYNFSDSFELKEQIKFIFSPNRDFNHMLMPICNYTMVGHCYKVTQHMHALDHLHMNCKH